MRIKSAIAFALVCLVGVITFGYLYLWRERDEQIINRNLSRVVELAEKGREEAPFVTLSDSREILRYVATNPAFNLGPPFGAITDREELGGMIMQVRQTVQTLSIRVTERQTSVAADRQSAQMEIEADASLNYAGEGGRDRRRFALEWIKEDGDWLIREVRMIEGDALPDFEMP